MLFPLEFYFCVQVLAHVLFRLLEGLEALALHLWSHLLVHRHHIIRSFQRAFSTTLESTPGFSPSTMRTKLSNSDSPSFLSGPTPPSVPSTHHPSPLHSFIPGLIPSFLQILPTVAIVFPRTNVPLITGLFTDTSEPIRFLLFTFFSTLPRGRIR